MEKLLEFCFKGGRNYLQGGDVFNKLIEIFGLDIKNINLVFYKLTNKNLLIKDTLDNDLKPVFLFEFEKLGKRKKIFGFETSKPITCRNPYSEEYVTKNAFIQNKCAILNKKGSYSFIEHLIALTKFLHVKTCPKEGKWYFVKIQLNKIPTEFIPLKVCLTQALGNKLTSSEVYIRENQIGKIYFYLGEKRNDRN